MESSVTFYENAEDLLKDSDNEFYVDEDGNHENDLEIIAGNPPSLTEEAHHSIVSSSFV
jgi:proteasome assembly chaperone (PAC2) family protein